MLQKSINKTSKAESVTYSVNIGEGVLRLAVLGEHTRSDLVDLADELEHRIVGQMLEGELALRDVARIGLAEYSMSVARNDLASVQSRPQIVLDSLIAEIVSDGLLHLLQPVEHFLVRPENISVKLLC